jgi:hypothetical protein
MNTHAQTRINDMLEDLIPFKYEECVMLITEMETSIQSDGTIPNFAKKISIDYLKELRIRCDRKRDIIKESILTKYNFDDI